MKQSEIWLINLDTTIGAEIKKKRPAIIVNNDDIGILPLKVIVPITDWQERYNNVPWMVKIIPDINNNLDKVSVADCFQIRSLSNERFIKRIGKTDFVKMASIVEAVSSVISIY
jgi:mRNA interferase MazF